MLSVPRPLIRTTLVTAMVALTSSALAQNTPAPAAPAPSPVDRAALVRQAALTEPDYTVINVPTTLALPRFRSAFRVTHRFARSLTDGTFGDLAGSLFGIDSGAQIGLEYRFGVTSRLQAGIYRTSDKTIELFGQYATLRQAAGAPASVDVLVSVEGLNNFHRGALVAPEDNAYATAFGVVVSRWIGSRVALYAQPSYVADANVYSTAGCLEHIEHGHALPGCAGAETRGIDSSSYLLALSSRVRLTTRTYVVGSWVPRVAGFSPDTSLKSFGVEKRLGGHVFQLNVSNSIGTTTAQMARGASNNDDWFMGFNISRRF